MIEKRFISIIENRAGKLFKKDYLDEKESIINVNWLSEFLGFTKVITFQVRVKFKKNAFALITKFCNGKMTLEELIKGIKEYVV